MLNHLVSVVVPVYNGAPYLEKTIESILAQDYSALEIVLVNDGSSDDSAELMDKLAQQDERIRPFHKENGGVACARNFGISQAKAEFIAFCDQDDLWLPTKLSKQIPLFENENVGLVYTGAIAEYVEDNKSVAPNFDDKKRGLVFSRLVEENMLTCCTAVVRRKFLEVVAGFDDDIALMGVDDWHLWLKLAMICEFDFVEEHLAVHVFHGDNYSLNNEKMHEAEIVCLDKIASIAPNFNSSADWEEIKQQLHIRYAACYIFTSLFALAGDSFIRAHRCKSNYPILLKGWAFKYLPDFIWLSIQKLKRAVAK